MTARLRAYSLILGTLRFCRLLITASRREYGRSMLTFHFILLTPAIYEFQEALHR